MLGYKAKQQLQSERLVDSESQTSTERKTGGFRKLNNKKRAKDWWIPKAKQQVQSERLVDSEQSL